MFLSRGRSCEAMAAFTRQGRQTGGLCQVACPGLGLGHPRQRMRLLRGRSTVYCGPVPPQGLLCCEVEIWGLAITSSLGRCLLSFPIEGLVIGNWPLTGFDGNPRT